METDRGKRKNERKEEGKQRTISYRLSIHQHVSQFGLPVIFLCQGNESEISSIMFGVRGANKESAILMRVTAKGRRDRKDKNRQKTRSNREGKEIIRKGTKMKRKNEEDQERGARSWRGNEEKERRKREEEKKERRRRGRKRKERNESEIPFVMFGKRRERKRAPSWWG